MGKLRLSRLTPVLHVTSALKLGDDSLSGLEVSISRRVFRLKKIGLTFRPGLMYEASLTPPSSEALMMDKLPPRRSILGVVSAAVAAWLALAGLMMLAAHVL